MYTRNLEQTKIYVTDLVSKLHKIIFNEAVFEDLKPVLLIAEEMECAIFQIEQQNKNTKSNVLPFKRVV